MCCWIGFFLVLSCWSAACLLGISLLTYLIACLRSLLHIEACHLSCHFSFACLIFFHSQFVSVIFQRFLIFKKFCRLPIMDRHAWLMWNTHTSSKNNYNYYFNNNNHYGIHKEARTSIVKGKWEKCGTWWDGVWVTRLRRALLFVNEWEGDRKA